MTQFNSWHVFLAYAKLHPNEIPASTKERAKLYDKIKTSCTCGEKHKLCMPMNFQAKLKQAGDVKYALLEAKIKAYEEYVDQLEAKLADAKQKSKLKSV